MHYNLHYCDYNQTENYIGLRKKKNLGWFRNILKPITNINYMINYLKYVYHFIIFNVAM